MGPTDQSCGAAIGSHRVANKPAVLHLQPVAIASRQRTKILAARNRLQLQTQRTLHSRLWSGKSRKVPTQPRAHPSRCQKQKTDQAGCRAENARRGSRHRLNRRRQPFAVNHYCRFQTEVEDNQASGACTKTPRRACLHEKEPARESRWRPRQVFLRRHIDGLLDPVPLACKPEPSTSKAKEYSNEFHAPPSPNRRAHRCRVISARVCSNVAAPSIPETRRRDRFPKAAG